MRESAVGFDSQATVDPELPLGAEAMRGLNQSDEQGCTDRPDSGNGLQAAPCGVLLAFAELFPAYAPLLRGGGLLRPGVPRRAEPVSAEGTGTKLSDRHGRSGASEESNQGAVPRVGNSMQRPADIDSVWTSNLMYFVLFMPGCSFRSKVESARKLRQMGRPFIMRDTAQLRQIMVS
jgi:hypothetical protein